MRRFTDTTGRDWHLVLTIGSAAAVKSALGVDLLAPEAGDPPLLQRLAQDDLLLGSVIAELLTGQMTERKMTAADVSAAFDGQTMAAASEAFYAELVDFFQSRGRRERARMVSRTQELMAKAQAMALAQIEAVQIPGLPSGDSPGSSPVTPPA